MSSSSAPASIDNEITRMCNIKYPIFMGGMGHIAEPKLVAAVSNAGGCGILSCLNFKSPNDLKKAIQETRLLTSKPFGVNISYFTDKTFLESVNIKQDLQSYNRDMAKVIIDEKIPIVETTATTLNSTQSIKSILSLFNNTNNTNNNNNNIVIIHKCHSIENALVARQYGANIISLDSFESGGHHGQYETSNLIMLPLAKRVLGNNVPLIASGGIVNGKQFASMLVLGAQGIKLGTRFCATNESNVNINCKLAMLEANNENSTIIAYKNNIPTAMRVYNNEKARQSGDGDENGFKWTFDVKNGMLNGKIKDYVWSIGQGVALIDDIPTCKEVVENIVRECRESIGIQSKL